MEKLRAEIERHESHIGERDLDLRRDYNALLAGAQQKGVKKKKKKNRNNRTNRFSLLAFSKYSWPSWRVGEAIVWDKINNTFTFSDDDDDVKAKVKARDIVLEKKEKEKDGFALYEVIQGVPDILEGTIKIMNEKAWISAGVTIRKEPPQKKPCVIL